MRRAAGRFETVVKRCWEEDPTARPDFGVICDKIEQFRRTPTEREDYYAAGDHRDTNDSLYVEAY